MQKAKLLRVDYVNTSKNGNNQYRGQFLIKNEQVEIFSGSDSCFTNLMRNLENQDVLVDYKLRRGKFVINDLEKVN